MKHLLNNLSEEEKNSIREQHEGGMKIDTSRFKTLLEGKSGDVKPLVEQHDEFNDDELGEMVGVNYMAEHDDDFEDEEDDTCPQCGRGGYSYERGCEDCDDEDNEYRWDAEDDEEELDEDTSWMNEIDDEENEQYDYTASGFDSMGDVSHSALKSKGHSHRGKDDEGEFYIVFDGEKFYEDDFEIASHDDMGEIPRVEDGKLIIANPAWGG